MESKNSRPGQPERFGMDTRSVNAQAKRWLSIMNREKPEEGFEQFHARLKKRLEEVVRNTDELIRNPKMEEEVGGWEFDDLSRAVNSVIGYGYATRGYAEALLGHFSRPGAKDTMASHKESFQKEYILWALPKGETDRLHERPIAEGITTPQQMDDAKRKAASQGWHGFRVQILDMNKPFRWMSRTGVKDKMAVEDRFYFGKGRKERFADDAKQIADTILKQLGGGRFVAMTGAKNLAYRSSPPGLSMSIGRGAKNGIKYFRVDYDRAMDTYTLIFMNNSGGTVREIPFVHAGEMSRVFTMTTGFDTSL